jgi:hypothetical protein
MSEPLYIGNDHVVELRGLKDATTGAFLNAATCTVTLIDDQTGLNVAGETWPLAMAYVTASNGVYRATLADTLTLVDGQRYTARISANGGAGKQARWDTPCFARLRT